jgi:hypothetical protein
MFKIIMELKERSHQNVLKMSNERATVFDMRKKVYESNFMVLHGEEIARKSKDLDKSDNMKSIFDDKKYKDAMDKMKKQYLLGRVLSGNAIHLTVNDLMAKLEQNNGLERKYKSHFNKTSPEIENLENRLESIKSSNHNSLNDSQTDDVLDEENEKEQEEVFKKTLTILRTTMSRQRTLINRAIGQEDGRNLSMINHEKAYLQSIQAVRMELMDKSHIHVHETITNMAILIFLKDKVKQSEITKAIQSMYVSHWGLVAVIQLGLMYCMGYMIFSDASYTLYVSQQ